MNVIYVFMYLVWVFLCGDISLEILFKKNRKGDSWYRLVL